MSRPVPTLLVVAAAGVTVLLLVRVEAPGDLGRWDTAALPGQPVLAVVDTGEMVVAGGRPGLVVLDGGARSGEPAAEPDHRTPAPVQAMATSGDRVWLGTAEGLGQLTEDGYRPLDLLPGPFRALHAAADGTLLAATDTGVHRVDPASGGATRLWPAPGEPQARVDAVLALDGGALLAHPEGLARLGAAGAVEVLVPDVEVVALGALPEDPAGAAPGPHGGTGHQTGTLWAGLRGGPLLLLSEDGDSDWRESGEGLGFNATNTLARDVADGGRTWRAGGSGLADGTGQAGVMTSADGGRTWRADQDRLSNTHVTGLLAREEPVRLGLRLAGGAARAELPLPLTSTRWYAATNGSGLVTQRPAAPALEAAAPLLPVLRLAEPLLLGSLLLALTVAAYRQARLTPLPRPDPRAAPGAGPPGTRGRPGLYPERDTSRSEPPERTADIARDPDSNNKENPYA